MSALDTTRILDYGKDVYTKVTNGEVVDSDWAYSCAIVAVTSTQSNDAYVYHHWLVEDLDRNLPVPAPELAHFIQETRLDFGANIKSALVSGVSIHDLRCIRLPDKALAREARIETVTWDVRKRKSLKKFLLEGLGIHRDQLLVTWGKARQKSRIIHDSSTGKTYLEQKPALSD